MTKINVDERGLTMLSLEYVNSSSHYFLMHRLVHPEIPSEARGAINQTFVLWILALVSGAAVAYAARNIVAVVAFLGFLCTRIYDWATYGTRYWASVEKMEMATPTKDIRLKVDADGLHETAMGIESFAPWKSVVSYAVFQDVLFIELAGRVWAMIPRETLSPTSASIEQVVEVLVENGVKDWVRVGT